MSDIPSELKYTKTHEWVRVDEDGILTIGITDHAQDLLGDLVYVELPDVGSEIKVGEEAGVIESVKAAADIYNPISGEIIAVNEGLSDTPSLINSDPYGEGWLFQMQPYDEGDLNDLLDAEEYQAVVESEKH